MDFKVLEDRRFNESSRKKDHREPYELDRARIIHSSSFRRLQTKTQILGVGEGDYHRSRLTHSLEVAQVGRSIVKNLRHQKKRAKWIALLPPDELIESICLAHDLGHPPFGHAGEAALNYCMQDHGGFEGNGQTLRILTRIEPRVHRQGKPMGLNLTRRTLLGILKYPVSFDDFPLISKLKEKEALRNSEGPLLSRYSPPKCFLSTEKEIVRFLFEVFSPEDVKMISSRQDDGLSYGKSIYKTLDCSIMDVADNIAYGIHDLEDAISLGYVSREEFMDELAVDDLRSLWRLGFRKPDKLLASLFDRRQRKEAIGGLVHKAITNVHVVPQRGFSHDLLRWEARLKEEADQLVSFCTKLVRKKVIDLAQVQQLDWRGQQIISKLFFALSGDAKKLLKDNYREEWKSSRDKERVVCDYIAGMTDEYANRLYERLFVPRAGRSTDQL